MGKNKNSFRNLIKKIKIFLEYETLELTDEQIKDLDMACHQAGFYFSKSQEDSKHYRKKRIYFDSYYRSLTMSCLRNRQTNVLSSYIYSNVGTDLLIPSFFINTLTNILTNKDNKYNLL